MADMMFLRYRPPSDWLAGMSGLAECLWVEFKTPKGEPTVKQLAWHAAERARGALTVIAGYTFPATIEGFWNWYSESGLKRKDIKLP